MVSPKPEIHPASGTLGSKIKLVAEGQRPTHQMGEIKFRKLKFTGKQPLMASPWVCRTETQDSQVSSNSYVWGAWICGHNSYYNL